MTSAHLPGAVHFRRSSITWADHRPRSGARPDVGPGGPAGDLEHSALARRRRRSALVRLRSERGSGTIWVLSVAMVLSLAAVAVIGIGQASTLRHRAHAAADLAALAGAAAAEPGAAAVVAGTGVGGDPCTVAAYVARANGADLTGCALASDGIVSVDVAVPGVVLGSYRVTALGGSRAGPADPATAP